MQLATLQQPYQQQPVVLLTRLTLCQTLCRFAKGVLSGVVPWREARRFFAWRLKRRLTEEGLIRHISSTDVSISRLHAIAMVRLDVPSLPGAELVEGAVHSNLQWM